MNPDRQQAIDYLCAPANGLWRWAEDGAVVVWRDGTTIAFREEVRHILDWLAPNELPSFGAIVFLLAACRGKLPAVEDIVVESKAALPTKMGKDAAVLLSARRQLVVQLEAALAQLGKLSELPREVTSGITAKCVLAEAVFEPARSERHVRAREVLRGLQFPLSDSDLFDAERPGAGGSYIRQIHIVAEGLKPHTAESLALRLRTGLDALPKEVDVSLPTAERARRLIEELSRDRELGPMARAARELMAATRLPRRLGEREQLALGGVADLTNRGPLDRLLLSELAHDDLTLAVRVALNEALYLRREPPMREPPGTLALLLDSGLRLWGVPRVLAASVGLAMIACDKQHGEVQTWRAQGKELQPVDLLTRQGLVQHLGALEVDAQPGAALRRFGETAVSDVHHRSVLITHPDVLGDPEFRRALAGPSSSLDFVATVDRAGHFELHLLPLAHRPPICEADLDLTAVFDEQKGAAPIKHEIDPDLPAILGMSPFPFLLPVASKLDYWVKSTDGLTYGMLNDRSLIRFRDPKKGARVLATDLPAGKTLWMDCIEGAVHVVKAGASQRPARLVSLPLDASLRVTELVSGAEVLAAHRYGEVILVIRQSEVRAYSLNDGRMLGRILNPHRWVHGRFFRGDTHFYFAVWNGQNINIEQVTMPNHLFGAVTQIFDREGTEGPWLLLRLGEIFDTDTGQRTKLKYPINTLDFSVALVSRCGHRLAAANRVRDAHVRPGPARMFDLVGGDSWQIRRLPTPDFQDHVPLPVWNLYRSIEAIAILPAGLALRGRENRWRVLGLDSKYQMRIRESSRRPDDLRELVAFPVKAKPTRLGCALQTVEWPNGNKAFLDSRGLLHLKSHDPDLPEVSLVLAVGEVAGWTSDGYTCGPSFFFEEAQNYEPFKVFERMLQVLNS